MALISCWRFTIMALIGCWRFTIMPIQIKSLRVARANDRTKESFNLKFVLKYKHIACIQNIVDVVRTHGNALDYFKVMTIEI